MQVRVIEAPDCLVATNGYALVNVPYLAKMWLADVAAVLSSDEALKRALEDKDDCGFEVRDVRTLRTVGRLPHDVDKVKTLVRSAAELHEEAPACISVTLGGDSDTGFVYEVTNTKYDSSARVPTERGA